MSQHSQEIQKSRIERDLASFSDPGGVKVHDGKRQFHAEWTMRGKSREATFTVSLDRGTNVKANGEMQTYDAFLAGTRMADLRHVAQMIRQAAHREVFVPTRACRTETNSVDRPATDLLTDLLENHEADATQVLMVTGEAGAGKTRVLQELVLRQADKYLHGQTAKLLLYVNAQGRALARLNEALATELQDLKVNLTYHSIATLARVGLLVPVIDGFDELLGVSGYDDAFNSLATFLEQLDGEGRLIASARSVYYEEEFLSRANRVSTKGGQAWSHLSVKIVPWEDEDREEFLSLLAEQESLPQEEVSDLRMRAKRAFKGNEELASKPLFFAKTVDLLRSDPEYSGGADLLGTLTRRYLEREQKEKLLDRQQQPLLSERHLEQLMSELAEEMWNQETRELDRRSVREVAEYVLDDEHVSEFARETVVERMPTLAFLAPSEKHESIQFEHEVFFFRFLSRAFVNQYVNGADMRIILSRSALPEFVAERMAFELRHQNRLPKLEDLQEILDRLSAAGRPEWRRSIQVRENAGLIVLALLREFASGSGTSAEIVGQTISAVDFPGSDLRNVTLRDCTLADLSVRRTNLEATKFVDCRARNVMLLEPRVKVGSTRLELNGLRVREDVHGVQLLDGDKHETIYAPDKVMDILNACGVPVKTMGEKDMRKVPKELVTLLERLMRAYQRANPVCEDDQVLKHLFNDERWAELKRLLVDHGIVKTEFRHTKGSPKTFLRRQFLPDEIMSGSHRGRNTKSQIARFWESLEKTAA